MDSVRITAFLLTCRCGSTEKGTCLVNRSMLVRIQSSALTDELSCSIGHSCFVKDVRSDGWATLMISLSETLSICFHLVQKMTPRTIFCDEAGFDGNNLWNPEQPHFVYAAVELSPQEADEIVSEARSRFSITTDELHAARMLRRDKGRETVAWILDKVSGRFQLACFHKRYSLAGKFFEYMIEPTISDGSNYFYDHGFHKFITNGLYFAALAEPGVNELNLTDFQELIRSQDAKRLTDVIHSLAARSAGENSFLQSITAIFICNQHRIKDELQMFDSSCDAGSVIKWLLELTITALRALCVSASGQSMRPLIVTCDDSKPLRDGAAYVNTMVGRTDFQSIKFDNRESQLTFNLSEDVRFASSKNCFGIQIADVAASSAAFALKRPSEAFSQLWIERYSNAIHEQSVFPDPGELDLNRERAIKNSFILQSLMDRSIQKKSLYSNLFELNEFVSMATAMYLQDQSTEMPPS